MTFLSAEITIFEHISTNIAESPIVKALTTLVVKANVGQVPSTSTNTGFSFKMPFISVAVLLDFKLITPTFQSKINQ